MMRGDICLGVLLVLASVSTGRAQWLHHPDPKTPRTADGKPNLTAPMLRTPDGKPDLSGVWMRVPPAKRDNPGNNNLLDYMPDGATISMRPDAAWSPVQDRRESRTHADSLRAVGPSPSSVHGWTHAPGGPATRVVWVCD